MNKSDLRFSGTPFSNSMVIGDKLKVTLGVNHLSEGERYYVVDSNMLGGAVLALITSIIEAVMLIQNFSYSTNSEVISRVGWPWITQHRIAYIVQLISALVLFLGALYANMRKPLSIQLCNALLTQYLIISIGFGIYIACQDVERGHGVYALLTQIVAIACVFSIRPILLVPIASLSLTITMGYAALQEDLSHGERTNLVIFFIIVSISCCIRYFTTIRIARDNILLEERAHKDGLTGLGNIHALKEDFPHYMGHRANVSMLDINNLKLCNDELGHAQGNTALILLADALRTSLEDNGTCYRTGGDEFAVISTDISRTEHTSRIERARKLFTAGARARGLMLDSQPLTVSVGNAHGLVSDQSSMDLLFQHADQAMYRVKHEDKERVG